MVQHPRLKLMADRQRSANVDEQRAQAFARGQTGLTEALGPDREELSAMRRQAQALFAVRRPNESIVILRGLFALGAVQLEDVVLMMLCHQAIGDDEATRLWSFEVDRFAMMMDEIVGRQTRVES